MFLPGPFLWWRLETPIRLPVRPNDFQFQVTRHGNCGDQIVRIDRVARRAGGEHTNGDCLFATGQIRKAGNSFGGFGNGIRLQAMRFVEIFAQACLAAFFKDWLHVMASHISHEQFYGIGANVYNGATRRFDSPGYNKKFGDNIEVILSP